LLERKHPLVTSVDTYDINVLVSRADAVNDECQGLDKTLTSLKLRIIRDSDGLVVDRDESVDKIRTLSDTGGASNRPISSPQDVAGLIQYYRRFIRDVRQTEAEHNDTGL